MANYNKKILYLAIDLFKKGGIQRYCRTQVDTLNELVGLGNVTVFTVYPPTDNQFEETFGVDYSNKMSMPILRQLCFALRVALFTIRYRPDVIWVNHIKLLPLAIVFGKLSKIVLNVYGLEIWSGLHKYEIYSMSRASYIISDCYNTASYIKDVYKIPENRVAVIWDPVDVNRFVPRETAEWILPRYGVPYKDDTCYLMTLGRVSKVSQHKGYDRMLDVMKRIEKEDIVYLIAGDGDDRSRLEMRVVDEGLQGRVYFLGSITEMDLTDVYNSTDIFILISDRGKGRGEGVPLTPLEAAGCGKPIIVGNEDGSREAIIEGENGYCVSPSNIDEILSAILRLVNDEDLRLQMGCAARKRVEEEFSIDAFLQRTEKALVMIFSHMRMPSS